MRHGDAVDKAIAKCTDSERPLSPLGKSEAEIAANFIQNSKIVIDQIIHSPYKRTKETANLVNATIRCPNMISSDLLLPEASPQFLINSLFLEQQNCVLVGHMPFMPELLGKLSKTYLNFPTGGVVHLEWKNFPKSFDSQSINSENEKDNKTMNTRLLDLLKSHSVKFELLSKNF